ncbi:uncharacterized protein LOC143033236 [Oratosquilla oratoria]|uniref:uncharacterized protein LOC143033236 n=1 Tax=Oratosquilla oratoria TaxID=337810 RepID=UPI003F76E735
MEDPRTGGGVPWPPSLTSSLRLLLVTGLLAANGGALWRTLTNPSRRKGAKGEVPRFVLVAVIVCSLVYLTAVWVPFTAAAIRHDWGGGGSGGGCSSLSSSSSREERSPHKADLLKELKDDLAPSEVDLRQDVSGVEAELLAKAVGKGEVREIRTRNRDLLRPPPPPPPSGGEDESLRRECPGFVSPAYCSVQDLVTSSCAYSHAVTATLRLALARKMVDLPALRGSGSSGLVVGVIVGVPLLVVAVVRAAGGGVNLQPHHVEYSSDGYALYNIICDVRTDASYVLTLFLEWAGLGALLVMAVGVGVGVGWVRGRGSREEEEEKQEKKDCGGEAPRSGCLSPGGSGRVVGWVRDVILGVAAGWAWPGKPIAALVFFALSGPKWTNLIGWLSHIVVAIPLVFVPLAVLLSSCESFSKEKHKETTENEKDAQENKEKTNSPRTGPRFEKENGFELEFTTENGSCARGDFGKDENGDRPERKFCDNLKFYITSDVLTRPMLRRLEGDRQVILEADYNDPDSTFV